MKINLSGIYPEYKKDLLEAVDEMVSIYPVLRKVIKIIHLKKPGKKFKHSFATTSSIWGMKLQYEIRLNPAAFKKPDIRWKFISARPAAYYYTVKDVIYHEIGHCLQHFMPCEKFNLDIDKYNGFNYKKYSILISESYDECYREYFNTFLSLFNWNDSHINACFGNYAAENILEILPECFNNYYNLKNQYPELNEAERGAYEFAKAVIEDYKKYIPK